MEFEGTAASISGTCPALTFVLNGHVVRTATATVFREGACADLRNGVRVSVRGTIGEQRSLSANRVTLMRQRGDGHAHNGDGDRDDGDHEDDDTVTPPTTPAPTPKP